ncbi:hypothetical protein ABPG75_001755, partial [Micractinium tetrahymenae]
MAVREAPPVLRWPTVHSHPSPSFYLTGLPLPAPPRSEQHVDASGQPAAADEASVAQVAGALAGVDVSYLRPLRAPPLAAGEPRTALQRQVAGVAPGIFAGSAAPAAQQQQAHNQPGPAPVARAQAQQLPLPPPAAAPHRRAADQAPPAKRARLVSVVATAGRAQAVDTPAEEAAKAAAAYTAFTAEFIRKHEKGVAALAGAEVDVEAANGAAGGEDDEGAREEEEDGAAAGDAAATAALLRDVRRLAEETMRICQPELQDALRGGGVPLETLLRLLRLLQRLAASGAGRLLEPGDMEGGTRAQHILIAVEAAAAALHLMTVPNMPQRVYSEDVLEAVLDMLRFQLTYNIYPFHDARLRSAMRPKLAAAGETARAAAEDSAAAVGKRKPAKKGKMAAELGIKFPPAMRPLLDRVQAVLLLLADMLATVRLPGATLLPLLRACATSLTVEGQKLLQEKAVRLLVAAFKGHPAQWGTILEELSSHVIPHLEGGLRAPRDFPASEDARTCIQMFTAAVLQMIQACVDLPPVDCEPASMADCYKGAATCADYFWTLCFDRLPAARAIKSEGDHDFRALLQSVVKDLLAVSHQPAWPAASFLLLRFAALLQGEKGLRHPDQHVRQYCVDLLGSLAAQLYRDEGEAAADAELLRQLATRDPEGSADVAEEAPRLLLLHLADRRRAAHASTTSARTFMLCQAFAEEVTNLQKQDASPEQLVEKLVQYRQRRDELDGLNADVDVESDEAQRLMRHMVQSTLGRARTSMVQWLLECLGPACASTT